MKGQNNGRLLSTCIEKSYVIFHISPAGLFTLHISFKRDFLTHSDFNSATQKNRYYLHLVFRMLVQFIVGCLVQVACCV